MRRRSYVLRFTYILSLAIFPWLVMGPAGHLLTNLPVRFGVFVLLALAGSLLLRKGWENTRNFPALLLTILAYSTAYKIASFFPDVTSYPFSLGWSEVSRYYYASLFFAEKIYGTDLPLSVLHPSRYFMQSLPFLLPNSSLWLHRLWQVVLWIGMSGLTAWLLWRRITRRQGLSSGNQSSGADVHWFGDRKQCMGVAFILFAFLFFFQGPVYYHLLVMVALVLWMADNDYPIRTLVVVLIASLWAGISRINWLPVPGMLAASLYLLEKTFGHRNTPTKLGSFAPLTQLIRYFRWPVVWVLLGTITGYLVQEAYQLLSGNPREVFGSSFSSDLLWYRLMPNPTYSLGILPSAVFVSLPLLLLVMVSLWNQWKNYHILRLLGLASMLTVLWGGGVVVSVKIGGGSNLHNLDAYLVLLLVISSFIFYNLFLPDHQENHNPFPKTNINSALRYILLLLVIAVPCGFSLSTGGIYPRRDFLAAQNMLDVIQQQVDLATEKGEVLFISQRHLLTFKLLGESSGPIIDDYEQVFLMEMAMGQNQAYLEKFQQALQEQRFALILSDPLTTNFQGQAHSFGEENDAWVRKVAKPILCYYEPLTKSKDPALMLLTPRASPCK